MRWSVKAPLRSGSTGSRNTVTARTEETCEKLCALLERRTESLTPTYAASTPARHRRLEQNSMRPSGTDSSTRTHCDSCCSTSHPARRCPWWTGKQARDQRDDEHPPHLIRRHQRPTPWPVPKYDREACLRWRIRWSPRCEQSGHDPDWAPAAMSRRPHLPAGVRRLLSSADPPAQKHRRLSMPTRTTS